MSVKRQEVGEGQIRILSPATRQFLAARLDSRKILLSQDSIHRDWRGVAELAGLDVGSLSNSKVSCTEHTLHLWGQKGGTISLLWQALEKMDRYDVIDDTLDMMYKDYDKAVSLGGGSLVLPPPPLEDIIGDISVVDSNILTVDDQINLQNGNGLQSYDALVLFADEDIDFVQMMVEKLEGEYNLKLCLKERDLLGGLQFESESVVRLIMERCARVVVVLSPEFLESNINRYFTVFAHALSVDQRRRIVIPCMYKPCTKPAVMHLCHSLDYYRAKGYWNYWEKLRDSIMYKPGTAASAVASRVRIQEVPTVPALPSPVESSPTPAQQESTTPSPTQSSPSHSSSSFFSKLLRRGESKTKTKEDSEGLSDNSRVTECKTVTGSANNNNNDTNGLRTSSPAIPIRGGKFRKSDNVIKLESSSASGESSTDYTQVYKALPDAPTTPPLMSSTSSSQLSTTSSAALLISDEDTSPSSRSPSRFLDKVFRAGRHKKGKLTG